MNGGMIRLLALRWYLVYVTVLIPQIIRSTDNLLQRLSRVVGKTISRQSDRASYTLHAQ